MDQEQGIEDTIEAMRQYISILDPAFQVPNRHLEGWKSLSERLATHITHVGTLNRLLAAFPDQQQHLICEIILLNEKMSLENLNVFSVNAQKITLDLDGRIAEVLLLIHSNWLKQTNPTGQVTLTDLFPMGIDAGAFTTKHIARDFFERGQLEPDAYQELLRKIQ